MLIKFKPKRKCEITTSNKKRWRSAERNLERNPDVMPDVPEAS